MKTFIKENWFKIATTIALFLIVIALVVIVFTKTSGGEKAADYSQKVAACSKQAQIVLDEKKDGYTSKSTSVSQQNHYSKSLNKCFVKLTTISLSDSDAFTVVELLDAYESRSFISCIIVSVDGKTTQNCTIPPSVSKTGVLQNVTWEESYAIMEVYMKN